MDNETKLALQHQANTNKRYDGYFHDIWERLDRLPRWAVMLISALFGLVGFLGSSLLHVLLGK